jgi:hypothetical protein
MTAQTVALVVAVRVVQPVLPAQDQQQPHPQVDCTAVVAEVLNLPTKTVLVPEVPCVLSGAAAGLSHQLIPATYKD